MPFISRRDLLSAGVAAGTNSLLPDQLFSLPAGSSDTQLSSDSVDSTLQPSKGAGTPYSTVQQREILALARSTVTQLFAGKTLSELCPLGDPLGIPAAKRVNITLRHAGRIRGSVSTPGSTLGQQIVESVYSAAMDRSYGGHLTKWEAKDAIIEVWIQIGAVEIDAAARFESNTLLVGIEGLEIESQGRLAYYLPSVAITSKYKKERQLLEALCVKAGFERNTWLQPEMSVRRTQWLCLPSVGNAAFFGSASTAGTKLPFPLESSIQESASYLIRNQDASGLTAYLYDPISDQFVGRRTDIIRSAGCLYALSQVLESHHAIARDASFRTCTLKMARGLINMTVLDGDMRILREYDTGKTPDEWQAGGLQGDEEKDPETPEEEKQAGAPSPIGATALLTAALSGDTLRKEFAPEYKQLYQSIVSAQKPDGRFVTYFGETQENESEANFYPGEALLVLALEAERKNLEALDMCRRAFHPYMQQFRTTPTTAFIVWHLNVWSRIALLTGEKAYTDFAFEQADWLLKWQIKSHYDSRWIGGFSQSGAAPQIYSVAFTEAVVRALNLAIKTGDTERTRKYADCVRAGLRFCNLLRLEETQASLLATPERCKGGVAFGLVDRRIRSDSVQHFITLCIVAGQLKNLLL